MRVTFGPRGILQIDDARICFRNFSGEGSTFNRAGDRNFALVIAGGVLDDGHEVREVDAMEMAEALQNDVNSYGVGWNVKIKAPREEGDEPFIYMPVKVKFNANGPTIYVTTGRRMNKLDEESVDNLDDLEISSVDLDIRPYDDEFNGRAFRSAYLSKINVHQEIDRFAARYASEEYPEE